MSFCIARHGGGTMSYIYTPFALRHEDEEYYQRSKSTHINK